ncbi:hypothetical protein SLS53_008601 [Cytospora paraplurivora]|uniref:Uncharacterized protein n=1 Tax=Cytospora paraplurivora TaxID=2898453 RepID=A0AAN9YCU8_9PEZI
MNANGRLELHVPKQFTSRRPAVTFSCDTSSSHLTIDEHPLAGRLPKAMSQPSLQAVGSQFRQFAVKSDVTSTIKDAIANDVPQLSLHITLFSDATLVGISFPHTMMDALGFVALLQSWSLVLAGRTDEVPPILGARDDVLWETAAGSGGTKVKEDFILGRNLIRGAAATKLLLRFAWDAARNPIIKAQALYLPKSALDQLRSRVMDNIADAPQGHIHEKAFVSDSDVLTAWMTQIIASSEPHPRPVTLLRAVNARFRLASLLQTPNKGVYVQNMVLVSCTSLPKQIVRGPLGMIALETRRQLSEQTQKPQMIMWLQRLRQKIEKGQEPLILSGDPDSVPIVSNDLTKANLIGIINFKEAVVRQGDATKSRINPLGTMVYHHMQSLSRPSWKRHWFVILGKDHQGGTWITVALTRKSAIKLEEAVENM